MVITTLSLIGLLSCFSGSSASTFQLVTDTDSSIIDYEPPNAWQHLPGDCDGCAVPPSNILLSSSGTWTNGSNILPTKDADDHQPSKADLLLLSQKDGGDKGGGGGDDDGGNKPNEGPDADDPNFVPVPVTVTFRFNATAFALHALIPTFILPENAPSNTNISFVLDGISTGPAFTFNPSVQGQAFQDKEVLRLSGLSNAQHVVVGSLAPGSTFIVSYLNLTLGDGTPSTSSSSTPPESISNDRLATSVSSSHTSSPTSTNKTTKKDVTSFAAAIGSVVGVLSILALSTCLSLCCRRRKARKRLARQRAEEEEAEIREFGGRLVGPRPFRPRYFPGTLPPFDPDDDEAIPPAYGSEEGSFVMNTPVPPPIHSSDTLQVREVSSSAPVSIAHVGSAPLSLRRSSVLSLVSPDFSDPDMDEAINHGEPSGESAIVNVIETGPPEEGRAPLSSRRNIQIESREMREDEVSDTESGGLLSSDARELSPTRRTTVTVDESGEDR